MSNQLRFSIGIPAYKGRYLAECIQSILNQTVPVFELIIINDDSPDHLDEIVAEFRDDRIRYFKNPKNVGAEFLANNYNRCLEKANGDFFVLMGDDDVMAANYVEEFIALIAKFPLLDVYHCRSEIIDENSTSIIYTPSWPEYESVYDNIWHRMNGYRVQYIADFVFRTSAIKYNGGFYYMPLGWYTDDITAYIAMADKGIAHTNKPVLNYRSHAINISSAGNNHLKMKAIAAQLAWFHDFLQTEPKQVADKIIYESLRANIDRLIRKHQIEAIVASFNTNFLRNGISWIKKRKDFNLSLFLIFKAMIKNFIIKRGEKVYNHF